MHGRDKLERTKATACQASKEGSSSARSHFSGRKVANRTIIVQVEVLRRGGESG
jgi:hypothetical protein